MDMLAYRASSDQEHNLPLELFPEEGQLGLLQVAHRFVRKLPGREVLLGPVRSAPHPLVSFTMGTLNPVVPESFKVTMAWDPGRRSQTKKKLLV